MAEKKKTVVIVCSKGTLDMAYPPLFIASTAAAMDMAVHPYFTFWRMDIITKGKMDSLKLASVGNPSMPMPNIFGILPGMTALATKMMKGQIKKSKTPTIGELIKVSKENGVNFHACEPNMEMTGQTKEDLIPEVDDVIGVATYLDLAAEADLSLFI